MAIAIENASVRVLDKLYEIEQKCFAEEAFSRQQISHLLADYNSISLVAKLNSEFAGFAIARVDFVRNHPVGHIMTIDVMPLQRQKGVGTKLLLEIEIILARKGVKECFLEVREGNVAAIGLYEKLGYRKVSCLENYYGRVHGLLLKKSIK